jgi:hypothetical protein
VLVPAQVQPVQIYRRHPLERRAVRVGERIDPHAPSAQPTRPRLLDGDPLAAPRVRQVVHACRDLGQPHAGDAGDVHEHAVRGRPDTDGRVEGAGRILPGAQPGPVRRLHRRQVQRLRQRRPASGDLAGVADLSSARPPTPPTSSPANNQPGNRRQEDDKQQVGDHVRHHRPERRRRARRHHPAPETMKPLPLQCRQVTHAISSPPHGPGSGTGSKFRPRPKHFRHISVSAPATFYAADFGAAAGAFDEPADLGARIPDARNE